MTDLHKMRADALAAKEQLGSKKPSRQKAYERLYAQYGAVTANHVSNCDPDTVLKLLDAVGAIAQPVTDAPSKDVILAALEEYRCTGHVDEDGGVLLVDMLTSDGTTAVGVDEIEALADFIWGAISDAQPVQPAAVYKLAAIVDSTCGSNLAVQVVTTSIALRNGTGLYVRAR